MACKHENMCEDINANEICEDCGMIRAKDQFTYEKEWRYYGVMDTKHNTDPNRCHARKTDEKTIFKDVEKMGFSDRIIAEANRIYEECTHGKIYRGNSRKGIIFACIFHAYKLNGYIQSCEHLLEVFQIERRVGLKGLKFINLNAPKDASFRNIRVTIPHLIDEVMDKFHATADQKKEAVALFEAVNDRSSMLNRARPQSLAAAIVRYYIQRQNTDISIDYFIERVNLSELTIMRLVTEISRLIGKNDEPSKDADDQKTRQRRNGRKKGVSGKTGHGSGDQQADTCEQPVGADSDVCG